MLTVVPTTPQKRNGSMGPPALPLTPRSTPRSSRMIDLRSPTPSPLSQRGAASPLNVKVEADVKPDLASLPSPSPSPRGHTASSAVHRRVLPSRSPTPRPRAVSTIPRPSPIRGRTASIRPSASPSPARSVRIGSRDNSPASSEISISTVGGRRFDFNLETPDRDPRPSRRVSRPREGDSGLAPPAPILKSMPVDLEQAISEVAALLDKWQRAMEEEPDSDFRSTCLGAITSSLFSAESIRPLIPHWIGEQRDNVSAAMVDDILHLLKKSCQNAIEGAMTDFQTEGSRSKSRTVKQSEWYADHQRYILALSRHLKTKLPEKDAKRLTSKLGSFWDRSLGDLEEHLHEHVEVLASDDCFDVVDALKTVCRITITDCWAEKVGKK